MGIVGSILKWSNCDTSRGNMCSEDGKKRDIRPPAGIDRCHVNDPLMIHNWIRASGSTLMHLAMNCFHCGTMLR